MSLSVSLSRRRDAGREPIPRGHLRHHAADRWGAQPISRERAQPYGVAVPIETACPLGGGGGGREQRGPRLLQGPWRPDRRRTRPTRLEAAAPHGLSASCWPVGWFRAPQPIRARHWSLRANRRPGLPCGQCAESVGTRVLRGLALSCDGIQAAPNQSFSGSPGEAWDAVMAPHVCHEGFFIALTRASYQWTSFVCSSILAYIKPFWLNIRMHLAHRGLFLNFPTIPVDTPCSQMLHVLCWHQKIEFFFLTELQLWATLHFMPIA